MALTDRDALAVYHREVRTLPEDERLTELLEVMAQDCLGVPLTPVAGPALIK